MTGIFSQTYLMEDIIYKMYAQTHFSQSQNKSVGSEKIFFDKTTKGIKREKFRARFWHNLRIGDKIIFHRNSGKERIMQITEIITSNRFEEVMKNANNRKCNETDEVFCHVFYNYPTDEGNNRFYVVMLRMENVCSKL
jgi:hypothetical protein